MSSSRFFRVIMANGMEFTALSQKNISHIAKNVKGYKIAGFVTEKRYRPDVTQPMMPLLLNKKKLP